ncbi:MAG: hypothetical protein HOW97_12005 [Catenulispora sp.]|nr:hypothetical protein [Catenulispora sp.]
MSKRTPPMPPDRADHIPYRDAVAATLEAAGVEIGGYGLLSLPTPDRKVRSDYLPITGPIAWAMEASDDTVYDIGLGWTEETGWILRQTLELGAVRGYAYFEHDMRLGLVPQPAVLTEAVMELGRDPHRLRARNKEARIRSASRPDPELEAALRAYPPVAREDTAYIKAIRAALRVSDFDPGYRFTRPLAGPDGLAEGEWGMAIRLQARAEYWFAVDDGEIAFATLEWRDHSGWSVALAVWPDDGIENFRIERKDLGLGPDADPALVIERIRPASEE